MHGNWNKDGNSSNIIDKARKDADGDKEKPHSKPFDLFLYINKILSKILKYTGFNQGVADAFNKEQSALTDAEMLEAKKAFQTQLQEQLVQKSQASSTKNLTDGANFLAANAKKDGVITTESGLQYKIITTGDGAQPGASDTVTTHYSGTLIDGREF